MKDCALCHTNQAISSQITVHELGNHAPHTLLRCSCGLQYVDEPVMENKPFNGDGNWKAQFPDSIDVYETWGKLNQETLDVLAWQYAEVAEALGDILTTPGARILELGCARGYLLEEIMRRHPNIQAMGIEPSPVMAGIAQRSGLNVHTGIVETAGLQPGSIDAVIAFGAFIQVRDPERTLRILHDALKPGGVILLDSPRGDSVARALARVLYRWRRVFGWIGVGGVFGRYLDLVYNPGRFFYYTPETFTRLLGSAGFKVVSMSGRQPRSVSYGKVGSFPVRVVMRVVSWLERVTGRESWLQVVGKR